MIDYKHSTNQKSEGLGLGQASFGETSTEVPGPGQAFGAHGYQGKQ